MALDEGDKAIIRQIAFAASEHTCKQVSENFDSRLKLHQAECPVAKKFEETKNQAKGAWIIVTAVASFFAAIAALAFGVWK